jgi:hypothetical protein
MSLNWDIIDFQLSDNYIYSNIRELSQKNNLEIFDDVYIEYGKLDIKIPYNIDWPPMMNIIDDYLKKFKENERIINAISKLEIKTIKNVNITIDKNHFITSSFSCINEKNKIQKIEFNKSEIKQIVNNYEDLPFIRGKKYTKYNDFGIRGNALKKYSAIFNGMKLAFFGLSNNFENYLHINGFVLPYESIPIDFKKNEDVHLFGRMDNDDPHWTYLGKCSIVERYSENQSINYFIC